MNYHSTRGRGAVTASRAIAEGIAPDGGLYVPESIPGLGDISALLSMDYRQRAAYVISRFLTDYTHEELFAAAQSAYTVGFDTPETAPLRFLDNGVSMLELWHGPTCAFKDMALQIMPRLLTAALRKTGEKREVCILVATSGDTGKAALEGFKDVPGTKIAVFYPRDGVSKVQERQMISQEGANVFVSAVAGNFDDTQTGVKNIFADRSFSDSIDRRGFFLSSANSINWGRLVPQIAYYVSAYCDYVKSGNGKMGDMINVCVPTGNFGNILAAWYAKQMGLPIARLICASNANDVLTEFIDTGVYNRNREFYLTLSPSMDILVSSNLERLLYGISGDCERVSQYMSELAAAGRYEADGDIKAAVSDNFAAGFCNDTDTMIQISRLFKSSGCLIDTHTAVAMNVLDKYRGKTGDRTHTVVVSTASPYKFADSVLAALGADVPQNGAEQIQKLAELTGTAPPLPLSDVNARPVRFTGWCEKEDMLKTVDTFLK